MANLLENSSDWLEKMRHEHLTMPVTYKRGSNSIEIVATIGRTIFEIDSGRGVLERTEARDYLVLTGDLVISGGASLPERGDQIRELREGTTYIYEVMAPGKEPHYRYSDPYRKTLRIHTKMVGLEVLP